MTGKHPIDSPAARVAFGEQDEQDEQELASMPPILDQPFDNDSLYALRATLEAHVSQAGMPEGRTSDLVLTVHELATNVIRHGSGTGRVRIWQAAGMLHCQVSENGTAPGAVPGSGDISGNASGNSAPEVPEWPYEYGHGLWIARHVADRHSVRFGPGGAVAAVAFALPPPGRPAFHLHKHSGTAYTRLELIGDFDQRTAPEVSATIGALISGVPVLRLVVDLTGMAFWDSNGIGALLSAQQQINDAPAATMVLTGLSDDFRRRLDGLGFIAFAYSDLD